MSPKVNVIDVPQLEGQRRAFLLAEDRLGHYPEFRVFFQRTFALDSLGLSRPGYVAVTDGGVYELTFIGRSGEPFPSGLEISAVVPALEPLDEQCTDRDLWAILRWMIEGVGAPWTLADLDATGRLYRLPAAS